MFCTACGKQLFGGEVFCPYCGSKLYAPFQPGAAAPQAIPKPGLRGFAKGWTIFTIVLFCAYIAQNLTNLFNPSMFVLLLPALILLGLMVFGAVLMIKMKPVGFYIQLGAAILFLMLSGATSGRYMISTSGSLVVFISWIATKKQLDYTFLKKKIEDFILLEGFERAWVLFIIGYLTCQLFLLMINTNYNTFRYTDYLGKFLLLALCGIGAITGAAFILNKRSWGLWIMLGSVLLRMFTANSWSSSAVFRMNDAELNRFALTVILELAPALLTWLFTYKQVQYIKAKSGYPPQNVPGTVYPQQPGAPVPMNTPSQSFIYEPPKVNTYSADKEISAADTVSAEMEISEANTDPADTEASAADTVSADIPETTDSSTGKAD